MRHLGIIVAFTLPSVVLWWHVWAGGARSTLSCACWDTGQQVWFTAWPAYALAHGHLAFFSSLLWAPKGVNLLDNASALLVGTVLAPVTWLFGPVASTNVALTVAPGFGAWAGWLACRRMVSSKAAAVLGGFLFGYSPFVVSSVALGHLSIAMLVLPPIGLLVLHEILVGHRSRAWTVGLGLGVLACAQFLVSPEVLAITVLAGALGVVAAAAFSPDRVRAVLPRATTAFGVATGVAVLGLAWPVWYLLAGPRHITGPPFPGAGGLVDGRLYHLWDAGNASVTLPVPGAGSGTVLGPPGNYVGIGLLVVAVLSLVVARQRKAAWVFATVAAACTVISWGPDLWLSPTRSVTGPWMPWRILSHLPVVSDILPVRFAIMSDLALAVLVAIGIDTASRWSAWSRAGERIETELHRPRTRARLGAVGAHRWATAARVASFALVTGAVLVPQWTTYQVPIATQRVVLPSWFTTSATRLPPGSTVLTYPFPMSATLVSQPMVWQSVDGMRFALAGGYAKVPGRDGRPLATGAPGSAEHTLFRLTTSPSAASALPTSAAELEALRGMLASSRVTHVVVTDTGRHPLEAATVFAAVTGTLPAVEHGAWVWHLTLAQTARPYDAQAAFTSLVACSASLPAPPPGGWSAGPLPQAANRCVVEGARRTG